MAKFSSSHCSTLNLLCGRVLLPLFVLSQICFQLTMCGSRVHFLPGFDGPLPFVLETGYVGVGPREELQVFYYFFESENNPKEDPLLLWLVGGPGCSALNGIMLEIGPLKFKREEYNGSVPNLVLRPTSWTKVTNILFVELPSYTGFTYAKTVSAALRSDSKMIHQAHLFLRKWLIQHPEFLTNEVYIGGDSYSGIPVPGIAHEISQGNEKGAQPWINLQGYLLGNAMSSRREENYRISFAHRMGLISDELYESLEKNCKGEYMNVDSRNALCLRYLASFNEDISGISFFHILEPLCEYPYVGKRRSLSEKYSGKFLDTHLKLPALRCRTYDVFLIGYWANDDNVRNALHVHKGSVGKWDFCNYHEPHHEMDISSSIEYHINLSKKGYRSIIYSGDHDMGVPFMATQAWIRSLNYSIVDDWRPWYSNGQVAGYTRTYSNRMTYATIKGGGHTAPEFKPEECFAMYSRWISKKAL